jgi:hypothetical protein
MCFSAGKAVRRRRVMRGVGGLTFLRDSDLDYRKRAAGVEPKWE